ncbi:hypothetical protein BDN71DRAFT_1434388 [Pleurotus eryngii]|uniref:Uncharacterized protein n=1 Tax=Pleurotus eryngii TaxID=5323 RepID=A0A9P5ZNW6_PLEER|nr:hypothetical protein BDN71DRAFT_1434388 [Pleurotus eryngii]
MSASYLENGAASSDNRPAPDDRKRSSAGLDIDWLLFGKRACILPVFLDLADSFSFEIVPGAFCHTLPRRLLRMFDLVAATELMRAVAPVTGAVTGVFVALWFMIHVHSPSGRGHGLDTLCSDPEVALLALP